VTAKRLHSTAADEFFNEFVFRYHDKQYQTWLGGRFTKVGIDDSYDKGLQDRIAAGILSFFTSLSFSYVLKVTKDKQRENRIPIFERKFDLLEHRFFETSSRFLSTERPVLKEEHHQIANAELFLLRVLSSFKAVRYLINWGFFSEPLTILRSCLEQLAWCHVIGSRFDPRQLENPQPSKCISVFRNRFLAAGHLYGALSTYSHMEFEAQKHFVTGSLDETGIMQQSTEFKFFGMLFYSFLLIAYQYICRDFSRFYEQKYELKSSVKNIILPLRHLIAHALLRPELDRDEIAATLSIIYFEIFPPT
jgi:hypothetical protein